MSTEAALADTEITPELEEKFFESGGEVEELAIEEPKAEEVQEVKEEIKEEVKAEETKVKMVPYDAMHEERARRKELQERLNELEATNKRMEQTFQKVLERTQEKPPTLDEDPVSHLKYETEQLKQTIKNYDTRFKEQDQQQALYQQNQRFVSQYQAAATSFAKETPDFGDAYKYIMENRVSELQAAGYSHQEANQIIVQEEAGIVSKAFEDGVNPASRLYEVAKMRGYKNAANQNNTAKMEALEKGAEASKSLSNVNGKTQGTLSLEALASMEDDEFDKNWEKLIN